MDLPSILDYSQLLDVIAQAVKVTPKPTDTASLLTSQLEFLKFFILANYQKSDSQVL